MKRLFLFIYLTTVLSIVSAQTQHGHVKTRGRENANGTITPGTRLAGATITFKGNNSVTSGINGAFSFSVPNKTYCVTNVRKNGYQLYDPDLLGKIHKYSTDDIPVVMDTPDNVLADKLKSEKKIRRILSAQLHEKEDEIELLKEQQKITEEQYRKLQQELYDAQKNNEKLISDMAERYSTLDFDQLDDFQRLVVAYIQNGELTRADSLLNTKGSMEERSAKLDRMDEAIKTDAEDIAKRQEQHDKSVAMRAKALEDFAADCYSRYEICLLQHKNDSAAYWLELRASKDTLNVEWLFETGTFFLEYFANYPKTLSYYQMALKTTYAKYGETHPVVAKCYNKLGKYYYAIMQNSKALEFHKKALNILMEHSEDYRLEVAECYIGMGEVYIVDQIDTALAYYEKAKKIQKKYYSEKDPNMVQIYIRIGGVYSLSGNKTSALEYFKKALEIQLSTSGENHPNVAFCYNGMGSLYSNNRPKQLEYVQKALKILLNIYGENHPLVVTNYSLIASIESLLFDFTSAKQNIEKALILSEQTMGKNHPITNNCRSMKKSLSAFETEFKHSRH